MVKHCKEDHSNFLTIHDNLNLSNEKEDTAPYYNFYCKL